MSFPLLCARCRRASRLLAKYTLLGFFLDYFFRSNNNSTWFQAIRDLDLTFTVLAILLGLGGVSIFNVRVRAEWEGGGRGVDGEMGMEKVMEMAVMVGGDDEWCRGRREGGYEDTQDTSPEIDWGSWGLGSGEWGLLRLGRLSLVDRVKRHSLSEHMWVGECCCRVISSDLCS